MSNLTTDTTQKLLYNSYRDKQKNEINGYKRDNDLSGKRVQVYFNDDNDAVVVHRGTQGIHDLITDFQLGLGMTDNKRFKHAEKIQKEAEDKYGNVETIGHSLGGSISEKVGKDSKHITTLNKPVGPIDIFNSVPSNQTDYKTTLDPVSFLRPLQNGNNYENIPSYTINPYVEHATQTLNRLY